MEMLLAFCARVSAYAGYYDQLAQLARRVIAWEDIPTQAEKHGLGPLLYTHLQAAHVSLPVSVKRELQGLYLRHRHANQVKAQVLAEILTACQAAGIDSLVLKGAALAHLVYPEPGLRPMRDVDILVSKSQVRQAQSILAELGFEAPLPPPGQPLLSKHLVATRRVEGLSISVEVHHNLYAKGTPATELERLRPAALPFSLAGMTAYALGYEDMLDHLHQHMMLIFFPLRLIWVADLVGLAERFAAQIDWLRVNRRVFNALALFHHLSPLSEELLSRAPLKIDCTPHNLDLDFYGWPRYSLADQRGKSWWGIWRDSFYPSESWLRLYYGCDNTLPAWWWQRWGRHPLHILGWVADYILTRGKHGPNQQTPPPN